jgi:ribosomal protein S18 acetylase RimI-like enzyme
MTVTNTATITSVEQLSVVHAEQAVVVLADSFAQYPVMQHIIGSAGEDYDSRLRKLMRFFVAARYCRNEPVLAVSEREQAVAVALLTSPFQPEAPSSLAKHRESLWQELGQAARSRYEALGKVWQLFTIPEPRYHLNMIGVLKSHAGRGYGRMLLDAVHELSAGDPASTGVSLNTEDEINVPLYERFGYEIQGHVRAAEDLETWVMFRPDEGRR